MGRCREIRCPIIESDICCCECERFLDCKDRCKYLIKLDRAMGAEEKMKKCVDYLDV